MANTTGTTGNHGQLSEKSAAFPAAACDTAKATEQLATKVSEIKENIAGVGQAAKEVAQERIGQIRDTASEYVGRTARMPHPGTAAEVGRHRGRLRAGTGSDVRPPVIVGRMQNRGEA